MLYCNEQNSTVHEIATLNTQGRKRKLKIHEGFRSLWKVPYIGALYIRAQYIETLYIGDLYVGPYIRVLYIYIGHL